MRLPIAERVRSIQQSDIRRYSAICAAMGGVNLSQGVCDQPAPAQVKDAACRAIAADHATYTNLRGIAELRSAIARKMRDFNGIECDPETEVCVTVGAAGAFACAALATLNPGDECITFSPFYSYHVNLVQVIGGKVVYVDLHPPDWTFDPAALEAACTDRTRMIVINTPANPTGKVFSAAELKQIAALAVRRNLWLVTDEIYEYITYDKPHVSVGSFPAARERTLTISGASKTYAVTGWRVGYVVGNADLISRLAVLNDLFYICAPAPLQHALLAGLALPEEYYTRMRADYRRKREVLVDTLRAIGFAPYVPEGSYYLLAAYPKGRWSSARAAAEAILEQVGVATVPGSAFYRNPADGDRQLRFCFAKKSADLQEACARLRRLATGTCQPVPSRGNA
ncbi:MAG TPA: pyridoxal phosphate-dependent aminotransferase [Phycisphaerae bacterium]|nr:pyridoxal phosphate-dependent aminotransferase [Phycisphaerae bacterium]HNU43842.1 pyridoxal phosphate-dependent aminotransferase [Phycisphaerae bacterium]